MSASFTELDPKKQREVRAKVKKNLRVYVDLALLRMDDMAARMWRGDFPLFAHPPSKVFHEWQPHMRGLVMQKKHPVPRDEWVETFFEVAFIVYVRMCCHVAPITPERYERLLWSRIHRVLGSDKSDKPLEIVSR